MYSLTLSHMRLRRRIGIGVVSALIVMLLAGQSVIAQAKPAAEGAADAANASQTAKLFDDICYSTLPELQPIANLAKKDKWQPITGLALKAYAPEVPPDLLKAWSFRVNGVKYRASISSGPVDTTLQSAFPAFAKARAFACSLILPGRVAQSAMDEALQKLVGRAADERYDSGLFKVHFWSGVTEQLAALMYHYRPKSGAPGGLISFVVLKK